MKSPLAATAKNIQLIGLVLCLLFEYSSAEERKFDTADNVNTNEVIPKYSYSYNVQTPEGDQHGHRVTNNGAYSKGKYYVKFADGSDQDVQYYADHLGYHPQVRYITTSISQQTNTENDAARIGANSAELANKKTETVISDNNRNRDNGSGAVADSSSSSPIVNDRRSTDDKTGNEYKRQSPFSQQDHYRSPASGTELVNDIIPQLGQQREQYETRIMIVNGADIEELIKSAENDIKSNGTDLADLRRINLTDLVLSTGKRESSDPFYSPETNEISNSFLKKIVSVIPDLYPRGQKPLRTSSRPIVVTAPQPDEEVTSASPVATKTGPDDTMEEAQQSASDVVQVRHEASYEDRNAVDRQPPHHSGTNKQTGQEPANTETIEPKQPPDNNRNPDQLYIEPQFLQEQPVLTTTVEIQKSLPLIELDVVRPPEQLNDNHLTFGGEETSFPTRNLELLQRKPQLTFLPHPIPVPSQLVNFPFPSPTPPGLIYNVPVPLRLFATPDDYLNSGAKIPSIAAVSNSIQSIENPEEQQAKEENLFRENYYSKSSSQKQPAPSPLLLIHPNVAPTLPTLKQNGLIRPLVSPLDISSHYDQQRRNPLVQFNLPSTTGASNSLVRQLTPVAYRFHAQPINKILPPSEYFYDPTNLSAFSSNNQKSNKRLGPAPFKPSHPMWDSIYPPQHVYYVPLITAMPDNRIQHGRSAKELALSRRTNPRQQLQHLLIEYGGFKPPMVPSTLLSDVNNGQEKSSQ